MSEKFLKGLSALFAFCWNLALIFVISDMSHELSLIDNHLKTITCELSKEPEYDLTDYVKARDIETVYGGVFVRYSDLIGSSTESNIYCAIITGVKYCIIDNDGNLTVIPLRNPDGSFQVFRPFR